MLPKNGNNNKILTDMEKGKTNNPNGRPKGTPNKITADLREFISLLLNDNLEQLRADFEQLEGKDRLIMMERLLGYVLPKLSNITMNEEPEMKDKRLSKEEFLRKIAEVRQANN